MCVVCGCLLLRVVVYVLLDVCCVLCVDQCVLLVVCVFIVCCLLCVVCCLFSLWVVVDGDQLLMCFRFVCSLSFVRVVL